MLSSAISGMAVQGRWAAAAAGSGVGIVQAVNRGDTDAACRLTAEDAIVIPRRAATDRAYVGHDGVRSWFDDNKGPSRFSAWTIRMCGISAIGSSRLARSTSVDRGSQVETDVPSAGIRGGPPGLASARCPPTIAITQG